jgi:hypothetical protein
MQRGFQQGFAGAPGYLVMTAYQTANGLVNLVTPTSAVVMGGLTIARAGYGVWWRFAWPLIVLLAILSMLVLASSALMQQARTPARQPLSSVSQSCGLSCRNPEDCVTIVSGRLRQDGAVAVQ